MRRQIIVVLTLVLTSAVNGRVSARNASDFEALADGLGLQAIHTEHDSVALYTASDPEDGRHMASALIRCQELFRQAMLLADQSPRPLQVFHVFRQEDYVRLVQEMRRFAPYLGDDWEAATLEQDGFALLQPAVAVVWENEHVQRGVNRDNLLVHLASHTLPYRYFGVLPSWLREGMALSLEAAVLDQLYSYCGCDRFFATGEARGWRTDLRRVWRHAKQVDFGRLDSLTIGHYHRDLYHEAASLCYYLMSEAAEGFGRVLRHLEADRRGNLRRDRHYVTGPERQAEIFRDTLGEDWEAKALESLRQGPRENGLGERRIRSQAMVAPLSPPPVRHATELRFFCLDEQPQLEKIRTALRQLAEPARVIDEPQRIEVDNGRRTRVLGSFLSVEVPVEVRDRDLLRALKKGSRRVEALVWMQVKQATAFSSSADRRGMQEPNDSTSASDRNQLLGRHKALRWVEAHGTTTVLYYLKNTKSAAVLASLDEDAPLPRAIRRQWQLKGEIRPSRSRMLESALRKLPGMTEVKLDPKGMTLRIHREATHQSVAVAPDSRGPQMSFDRLLAVLDKYQLEIVSL